MRRSLIASGSRCSRTARSRPPASNTRGSTPSSPIAASPETGAVLNASRPPPAFQPQVDGAVVARRHRLPGHGWSRPALDAAIEVPVVDHVRAHDAVALERQRAVPRRRARPPAILGALVDEPHAAPEIGRRVGPHRLDQIEPVVDVEPLDRRRADYLDGELDLVVRQRARCRPSAAAATAPSCAGPAAGSRRNTSASAAVSATTLSSARLPVVA